MSSPQPEHYRRLCSGQVCDVVIFSGIAQAVLPEGVAAASCRVPDFHIEERVYGDGGGGGGGAIYLFKGVTLV